MLYFGIALYKTSPLKNGLKAPKLHIFHIFLTIYVILGPFWSRIYFQKIFYIFFLKSSCSAKHSDTKFLKIR